MILVQGIIFSELSLLHLIKYPIFFVIIPYLIYRIYGTCAFRIIAEVILFLAIISSPFWIIQNISSKADETLVSVVNNLHARFPYDSWPRSMIIYTVGLPYTYMEELGLYRNSGLFNEPGKFAFWINYSIIIFLITGEKLFSRKVLFMMGLLITTFSTGGYLQFIVLIITYFIVTKSYNIILRFLLLGLFLLIFITQYQRLDFMRPKIESQLEYQTEIPLEGSKTTGRFLRIRKGFNAIKQNPILGRGISTATQIENTYHESYIGNVGGLIGFTARYGIPISLLFFLFFFKGIHRIVIRNRFSTFLSISFFTVLMMGLIGQGTAIWNPITTLFFMHGYLKYP